MRRSGSLAPCSEPDAHLIFLTNAVGPGLFETGALLLWLMFATPWF